MSSTFTEEDGFQIAIGLLGSGEEFCDKNGTCVSQEKKLESLIDLLLYTDVDLNLKKCTDRELEFVREGGGGKFYPIVDR
mmetsp:Transcript_28809/g.38425  ORF Transcript_28809/g.38425 Transcript_28809/m.38425 type:complete len:80 (+) Transcript_28809:285-524(+)